MSRNTIKPLNERAYILKPSELDLFEYLNCIGIENLWIGVSMTHILENIQAQVTTTVITRKLWNRKTTFGLKLRL